MFQGHSLKIDKLIDAISAHGGKLLSQAPSNWVIPGPGTYIHTCIHTYIHTYV